MLLYDAAFYDAAFVMLLLWYCVYAAALWYCCYDTASMMLLLQCRFYDAAFMMLLMQHYKNSIIKAAS